MAERLGRFPSEIADVPTHQLGMMIAHLNLEADEREEASTKRREAAELDSKGLGGSKTIDAVEAFEERRRRWLEEEGLTEQE